MFERVKALLPDAIFEFPRVAAECVRQGFAGRFESTNLYPDAVLLDRMATAINTDGAAPEIAQFLGLLKKRQQPEVFRETLFALTQVMGKGDPTHKRNLDKAVAVIFPAILENLQDISPPQRLEIILPFADIFPKIYRYGPRESHDLVEAVPVILAMVLEEVSALQTPHEVAAGALRVLDNTGYSSREGVGHATKLRFIPDVSERAIDLLFSAVNRMSPDEFKEMLRDNYAVYEKRYLGGESGTMDAETMAIALDHYVYRIITVETALAAPEKGYVDRLFPNNHPARLMGEIILALDDAGHDAGDPETMTQLKHTLAALVTLDPAHEAAKDVAEHFARKPENLARMRGLFALIDEHTLDLSHAGAAPERANLPQQPFGGYRAAAE